MIRLKNLSLVNYLTTLIILFFVNLTYSQEIQWASRILSFSSELSPKEFSANQILGKADVLPEGGDNPNAWLPASPKTEEFIKVGFDNPQKIQQIAIAESYNPSAIFQIYAYDSQDHEYLINTFTPRPINLKGRLLNLFLDQTSYEVYAIKLVLRGISVPGYNGIDAIGISDSKIPIAITVEVAPDISEKLKINKLEKNINSEYKETRPLVSPDGYTLYFSRKNHPENVGGVNDPEDIWYSQFDYEFNEWAEAKNIGRPLNNSSANFISSISPDGNAMTVILGNLYQKNAKMRPGVSISTKSIDGWSQPVPLDIINPFIEKNDGDYFLTQNRKSLILAVERFDTYGGKDLYVSFQMENSKWSEPLNLGKDINTASDELAPFLAADDMTLYFSSRGYSGFGGADIFISKREDDTWQNWTRPENLGNIINSNEEDIFFNIPPSGQYAYFSKGNTEYDADIYRIELPIFLQPSPVVTIFGKIFHAETLEPLKARVSYELLPEQTDLGYTVSDPVSGDYEIVLPVGSQYRYHVDLEEYLILEDTIDLAELKNYQEIRKDLYLDPAKIGAALSTLASPSKIKEEPSEDSSPYVMVEGEQVESVKDAIEINDGVLAVRVQFDYDSYRIRKNSYPDLDRIINLLNNTPANIIVAGHTCDIGTESYNLILSKSRAKAVYEYLVQHGVDPDKLEITSYGEERPLESNDTLEGKERNRRVEFIRRDQFLRYNIKFEEN